MKRFLIPLLLLTLISCVKSDYDDRYWHQMSIDPTNTDTYEFLDIADGIYQFYHTRNNGDEYTFEVNCNTTTITSERKMTEARIFRKALDPDYDLLPITDNVITVIDLDPDHAIRIYHD